MTELIQQEVEQKNKPGRKIGVPGAIPRQQPNGSWKIPISYRAEEYPEQHILLMQCSERPGMAKKLVMDGLVSKSDRDFQELQPFISEMKSIMEEMRNVLHGVSVHPDTAEVEVSQEAVGLLANMKKRHLL